MTDISETMFDRIMDHDLELIALSRHNLLAQQDMQNLLSLVKEFYSHDTYQHWQKKYDTVIQNAQTR